MSARVGSRALMPPKALLETKELQIFISSSSDAEVEPLRTKIQKLVEVVSEQLISSGARLRVVSRVWERESARRGSTDHINDEFIKIARGSQHFIALLVTHLRSGTKEEIEAVIKDPDIELSLLVFPVDGDLNNSDVEVHELLDEYKEVIAYSICCDPTDDEVWVELTRVILYAVMRYLIPQEPPMFETRAISMSLDGGEPII
jgi:hypothetical protein